MKKLLLLISLFIPLSSTGCAIIDKANQADILEQKVYTLNRQLAQEKETNNTEIMRLLQQKSIENKNILDQKEQELNRLLIEKNQEIGRLIKEKERNKQLYQRLSKSEQLKQNELAKENYQLQKLLNQKEKTIEKVTQIKETELTELEKAKEELAKTLNAEIHEYKAKLEMTERGLILTFLAEIFFDSGKGDIRNDAKPTLQKVAEILNDKVIDSPVAVEGHTDNDPIVHSNWKSNWELSIHRALAVVHFFINEANITPDRLSAVGYGEFSPITSNETAKGKQQNRRVEIVILPAKLKKIKQQ